MAVLPRNGLCRACHRHGVAICGIYAAIYISGFVSIPSDLIGAASIDGASEAQIMRRIRLPLMVPSFVICLFLSITRCFKVYDLNISLTEAGPTTLPN